MKNSLQPIPVVLAFSAHDPSGAAGIQADIESINRNGGHCVSVITALTCQNTGSFVAMQPQNPADFRAQSELLLADIQVNACKIGLIGSIGLIHQIAGILGTLHGVPLVLDPVLRAGSGEAVASKELIETLLTELVPLTTVLTPNLQEALRLTGKHDEISAAQSLLENGCQFVLITGADESTATVVNTLYRSNHDPVSFEWERLPGTYHGSGCTLASAIATLLARKVDIISAVTEAQQYTWQTLKHAYVLGKSQYHPDRNYMDRP